MGSSLSKSSATATPAVSSARRSPYRKASSNPAKITTKIVVETTQPPKLVARPTEKKRGTFTAAIDQGTTSTRFIIFDSNGSPKANHQVEFEQLYPHSG
jgi:glycerol kinase